MKSIAPPRSDGVQSSRSVPPASAAAHHEVHGAERPDQQIDNSEHLRTPLSATSIEDTIASTDLHHTSDALNLLSQAAENATQLVQSNRPRRNTHDVSTMSRAAIRSTYLRDADVESNPALGILQYPLVSGGHLTTTQVAQLVAR
jgi:hypothetical protein